MSQILTSRQAEELYVHHCPFHPPSSSLFLGFSFTCISGDSPVCPSSVEPWREAQLFAHKTQSHADTKPLLPTCHPTIYQTLPMPCEKSWVWVIASMLPPPRNMKVFSRKSGRVLCGYRKRYALYTPIHPSIIDVPGLWVAGASHANDIPAISRSWTSSPNPPHCSPN